MIKPIVYEDDVIYTLREGANYLYIRGDTLRGYAGKRDNKFNAVKLGKRLYITLGDLLKLLKRKINYTEKRLLKNNSRRYKFLLINLKQSYELLNSLRRIPRNDGLDTDNLEEYVNKLREEPEIEKKKKQRLRRGRKLGSKSPHTVKRFILDSSEKDYKRINPPIVPGMILEAKLKDYLIRKYFVIEKFLRRSLVDIITVVGMSSKCIKVIRSNGAEYTFFPDEYVELLERRLRQLWRNYLEKKYRDQQIREEKNKPDKPIVKNPDLRRILSRPIS